MSTIARFEECCAHCGDDDLSEDDLQYGVHAKCHNAFERRLAVDMRRRLNAHARAGGLSLPYPKLGV